MNIANEASHHNDPAQQEERQGLGQTLYEVKLVFPRGDVASLLFGFNAAGKITGINLLSLAGD
jgi:hypothetical protein